MGEPNESSYDDKRGGESPDKKQTPGGLTAVRACRSSSLRLSLASSNTKRRRHDTLHATKTANTA